MMARGGVHREAAQDLLFLLRTLHRIFMTEGVDLDEDAMMVSIDLIPRGSVVCGCMVYVGVRGF